MIHKEVVHLGYVSGYRILRLLIVNADVASPTSGPIVDEYIVVLACVAKVKVERVCIHRASFFVSGNILETADIRLQKANLRF